MWVPQHKWEQHQSVKLLQRLPAAQHPSRRWQQGLLLHLELLCLLQLLERMHKYRQAVGTAHVQLPRLLMMGQQELQLEQQQHSSAGLLELHNLLLPAGPGLLVPPVLLLHLAVDT